MEKRTEYVLSTAGICDNCKAPKMINTGGDGIHEPAYTELYCEKKKIFIEPQPLEDQVNECDYFEPLLLQSPKEGRIK